MCYLIAGWDWLKSNALWALGVVAALAIAYANSIKAKLERERRQRAEATRETERRATDALTNGLKHEQGVRNAPVDTRNRTDFE